MPENATVAAQRRTWLGLLAGAGVVVAGGGIALQRWAAVRNGNPAPLVGSEAPDFSLPALGGTRIELRQFRGQPVVLNFWATWCAPCKEELPEFEQVYRSYKELGLVVLAVSEDDESSVRRVRPYVQQGGPQVGSYTFPVALDQDQEVGRRYHLPGLPGTYFVDAQGIVQFIYPGAMSRQMFRERLKTILTVAG